MLGFFNIKPTIIRSHALKPTFTCTKSNSCATVLWPSKSHFEALYSASFPHFYCQAVKPKMLQLMNTLRASLIKSRIVSSVPLNVQKQSLSLLSLLITEDILALKGLILYWHSLVSSSQIQERSSRWNLEDAFCCLKLTTIL